MHRGGIRASRLLLIFSLFLCFFSATAPAAESAASKSDPALSSSLYLEGIKAYKEGSAEKAVRLFEASYKAHSSNFYPLLALARLHAAAFSKRKLDYMLASDACKRLAMALSASPPLPLDQSLYEGYLDCAELFLNGGEKGKALSLVDKFIKAYPDYYDLGKAYNLRGVALMRQDRYEEAVQAFLAASNAEPDFIEPLVNLRSAFSRLMIFEQAVVLNKIGRRDEALERIEFLASIAEKFIPATALKGDILRDMGREEDALSAYETVLAADDMHPSTHGVRLEMAKILEKQGRLRDAVAVLNQNVSRFRDVENDPTKREILRLIEILRESP